MRWATILNGQAQAHAEVARIAAAAERHGARMEATTQPGDAARLAAVAVERGVERIVIAGGDGTVREVVQGLSPDFPPVHLGIIPLGTGNDLARSLDLPINDTLAAIEAAFTWQPVPIDVVRVTNGSASYFVNAATGGFGGEVTNLVSAAEKQLWGGFAYWMKAVSQLGNLTEYDVVIESDSGEIRERIYGLAINNGRSVGGGFPLAPSASLNDGQLDISVVPLLAPLELLAVGVDLSLGRRRESQYVHTFRTRSFCLHVEPTRLFSLDGELECRIESHFQVLPRRLHVCAGPAPALEPLDVEQDPA